MPDPHFERILHQGTHHALLASALPRAKPHFQFYRVSADDILLGYVARVAHDFWWAWGPRAPYPLTTGFSSRTEAGELLLARAEAALATVTKTFNEA